MKSAILQILRVIKVSKRDTRETKRLLTVEESVQKPETNCATLSDSNKHCIGSDALDTSDRKASRKLAIKERKMRRNEFHSNNKHLKVFCL